MALITNSSKTFLVRLKLSWFNRISGDHFSNPGKGHVLSRDKNDPRPFPGLLTPRIPEEPLSFALHYPGKGVLVFGVRTKIPMAAHFQESLHKVVAAAKARVVGVDLLKHEAEALVLTSVLQAHGNCETAFIYISPFTLMVQGEEQNHAGASLHNRRIG